MEWKTVYVFVSSTFNDMHAERDLLVKRVFPELRLWCARRKLQLREIDLRWGVSAADAQENKRVVEVCLRNIDKCRPFFLCFMGQRRGWVPGMNDINPETLDLFPELKPYIGKASVTEMEIIHALLHPLAPSLAPVRHQRFYFREETYVKDLKDRAHKDLYIPGRGLFRSGDKAVEAFKKDLSRKYPVVSYTARWNPQLPSPELTGELAKGRLEDFRTGDMRLEDDMLAWLKAAVAQEFPDHQELPETADPLDRELDRQDTQRFYAADGYIPRPAEEQALENSLIAAGNRPLFVEAEAGCGKTSLLAHWLDQQPEPVYYRFVGTTPQSFRLEDLSQSLIAQWVRDELLPASVLENPVAELKLMFPNLCVQAAQTKPFLLVLDGMDQLLGAEAWLNWLPKELPAGASMVVSLRRGSVELPKSLAIHSMDLMTDPKDKALMAQTYLNGFLKDLDEDQLTQLLNMEGSSNPLFMKIVLNELRQHGSFDTLMDLFRKDFGSTPLSAFRQVLVRVEQELRDSFFDPGNAVLLFLLGLANARRGLDSRIFLWGSRCIRGWDEKTVSDRQVLDLVYGLARELEPYLVLDGGTMAIRYDSFRSAICQYYGPESSRMANVMLTMAFQRRLSETHDKEDARTALEHLTDATDDYIRWFFGNPRILVDVLRDSGAELMAMTCRRLIRQRDMKDLSDLEGVLNLAAARLNTNANTLLLELERYGDPSNPVTAALLERGKAVDTGVLLRPRYAAAARNIMRWEFAHREPDQDGALWAEPWYVIISGDTLWVMDLTARETVNLLRLPKDRKYRLAAQGEELLLCGFSAGYDTVQILRYHLPDLSVTDRGPVLDCPYGNPWKVHFWDGHIYAMQYSNIPDSRRGRFTVSCLDSGAVTLCEELPDDTQYDLVGGWFVYRDARCGDILVLSLRDGSCKFRDRFLGTDHLDPNVPLTNYTRLFANTANLFAAYGDVLYIRVDGSRILPGGKVELLNQMIRLLPEGDDLRLDRVWTQNFKLKTVFQVINGNCLISVCEDMVTVVDPDAGTVGKLKLGEKVSRVHIGTLEDQLLFFHREKIQCFGLKEFLGMLKPDVQSRFVGGRSAVIDDGCLYVMDTEMERVDLKTLELTTERYTGEQLWEIYAPWNMLGQGLWIGWNQPTGSFTIKDPMQMERLFHLFIPDKDTQELRHAFLYTDKEDVPHVGLVVYEKHRTVYKTRGENCAYAAVKLRTKPLAQIAGNTPWEEIDLDFKMAVPSAMCPDDPFSVMVDGEPYLVLYNGYVDEWTCQLRVYDVLRRRFMYNEKSDLHEYMTLLRDSFHPHPGGFLFKQLGRRTIDKFYTVDLEGWKANSYRRDMNILTKDRYSVPVCLLDRYSYELSIYDTKTHEMETVLKVEDDFWPTEAVIAGARIILFGASKDEIRIYERETGKRLAVQRLELVPRNVMYDDATRTLVMVDNTCRKYFWRLEEWGRS